MSDVNDFYGKELKLATLESNIFVPGVGEIRKELSNVGDGRHQAVRMTVCDPWVLVEMKDKVGKPVKILIPSNAFTHAVLA